MLVSLVAAIVAAVLYGVAAVMQAIAVRAASNKPAEDVRQIRPVRGTRVIDESERMMLVEAPDGELRKLMSGLSRWVMGDEQTIPLPDPRERPS